MRRAKSAGRACLPDGDLYSRLLELGWDINPDRDKNAIPCPFHDDRSPSAFVSRRNVFYCSVCTPNKGLCAAEFFRRLGVPRPPPSRETPALPREQAGQNRNGTVTLGKVRDIWKAALARVASGQPHIDSDAMAFIRRRGLESAAYCGLFGVLERTDEIRHGARTWHELGVRVVAPLYDLDGELSSLQGRNVLGVEPRLLFPSGRPARSTLFANPLGLDVLGGRLAGQSCVVVEGLTDFLAVGSIEGIPVLGLPGASMVRGAAGGWMRGRELIVAFDADAAGIAARQELGAVAHERGAASVQAVAWPPGCKDVCEFMELNGYECLRDQLGRAVAGGCHE